MKNPRILIEGSASWLHYENLCRRDHLFSETYLRYPIAQILQTYYGDNVQIEYPHPILSKILKKGDKRRIDFVVLDDSKNIRIAIETKWLNTSHDLVESIISDAIRLELLASDFGTTAFLILGVEKEAMKKFSHQKKLAPHPQHPSSSPLIPLNKDGMSTIRLNPPAKYRYNIFKKASEAYIGLEIAHAFEFRRTIFYPEVFDKTKRFLLYGWRIECKRYREKFFPENVFDYSKEHFKDENH
jgi:hypothetical protein